MKEKIKRNIRVGLFLFVTLLISLVITVPEVQALRETKLGRFINMFYTQASTVTITATPIFGAMPITDFQVTEVNGDLICTWENSPVGTATMIRAKYGSAPADILDGYLVYYGPDETAVDNGVYLDENISEIVFVAWADTPSGWSSPVQAIFRGIMDQLILLLAVSVLMGFAYLKKIPVPLVKMAAGAAAIAFGAYWLATGLDSEIYVYLVIGAAYCITGIIMVVTSGSKT